MIPKTINVGPLTFHLYGVVFSIAILIGWILAKRRAGVYKIPEQIFDEPIFLIPLILGILGARLYHVIDYWEIYSKDPVSILNLAGGGLGIWGGLAGAFLGFWTIAKIKKLDTLAFFDLLAPPFLLGQSIGRIGNFINQEAFGPPTNLPWGIYISPQNRPAEFMNSTRFHPTFFYEAAIDAIFFVVLMIIAPKFKRPGQVLSLYLMFYSSGRLFAEYFRIDTWTIGNLKTSYVLSLATFSIGLLLLANRSKEKLSH